MQGPCRLRRPPAQVFPCPLCPAVFPSPEERAKHDFTHPIQMPGYENAIVRMRWSPEGYLPFVEYRESQEPPNTFSLADFESGLRAHFARDSASYRPGDPPRDPRPIALQWFNEHRFRSCLNLDMRGDAVSLDCAKMTAALECLSRALVAIFPNPMGTDPRPHWQTIFDAWYRAGDGVKEIQAEVLRRRTNQLVRQRRQQSALQNVGGPSEFRVPSCPPSRRRRKNEHPRRAPTAGPSFAAAEETLQICAVPATTSEAGQDKENTAGEAQSRPDSGCSDVGRLFIASDSDHSDGGSPHADSPTRPPSVQQSSPVEAEQRNEDGSPGLLRAALLDCLQSYSPPLVPQKSTGHGDLKAKTSCPGSDKSKRVDDTRSDDSQPQPDESSALSPPGSLPKDFLNLSFAQAAHESQEPSEDMESNAEEEDACNATSPAETPSPLTLRMRRNSASWTMDIPPVVVKYPGPLAHSSCGVTPEIHPTVEPKRETSSPTEESSEPPRKRPRSATQPCSNSATHPPRMLRPYRARLGRWRQDGDATPWTALLKPESLPSAFRGSPNFGWELRSLVGCGHFRLTEDGGPTSDEPFTLEEVDEDLARLAASALQQPPTPPTLPPLLPGPLQSRLVSTLLWT